MRIYPAYGRTIAAYAMRGLRPAAVGVLLSSRWWYYEHAARVCIRPDEWALGRWEFGFLRGQHVVAIWGDEVEPPQFGELLIELMRVAPRLIWTCDVSGVWRDCEGAPIFVRLDSRELLRGVHAQLADEAYVQYCAGFARAEQMEAKAFERMTQNGGDVVQFMREQDAARRLAERLFSSPYAAGNEQAA